ncbi:hypothetical protein K0B03_04150 [Patescibacteria group bacterium]|nr:hypothetical protein [Patescibacteria group bacterium]
MSRNKSKKNKSIIGKDNPVTKEYNMKSDFINLSIIIIIFASFLVGLYYYDLQSNILAKITEQILGLF